MGNENLTSRYPVRDIALQALFVCYKRINSHLWCIWYAGYRFGRYLQIV